MVWEEGDVGARKGTGIYKRSRTIHNSPKL